MARRSALLLLSLSGCLLYPWDYSESSSTGESSGSTSQGSSGTGGTSGTSAMSEGSASGSHGSTSGGTVGGTVGSTGSLTDATTGAPPACGDGALDAEEECDDGNLAPDDGCNASCARDRFVFATSEVFSPDLIGGLVSADSLCKQLAHKGDLPHWATFNAWLSDSKTDAIDRVHHGRGRYVRPDGVVVAESFDALLAGPLLAPIVVDEYGETVNNGAWTGTRPDGTAVPGAWHCGDWTSNELLEFGHYGDVQAVDGWWTFVPDPEINPTSCISKNRLYCFEGK